MVPRVRAEERMESVVLTGEEARGEAVIEACKLGDRNAFRVGVIGREEVTTETRRHGLERISQQAVSLCLCGYFL
jgi:hypothetical protein